MTQPTDWRTQFAMDFAGEINVDLFAGGGGASTGLEMGLDRPVHVAINHDADAISMHQANHPGATHYQADVYEVDPLAGKGYARVTSSDFLGWSEGWGGESFDRIVMNPPYSQGRALAHVAHAAQLLKPGGRLVALLPAGLGGSNKLPDGRWGALFERAFAGTDIATRLFIHDRPRGGREQA